jgi:hypothetical protein
MQDEAALRKLLEREQLEEHFMEELCYFTAVSNINYEKKTCSIYRVIRWYKILNASYSYPIYRYIIHIGMILFFYSS